MYIETGIIPLGEHKTKGTPSPANTRFTRRSMPGASDSVVFEGDRHDD